MPARKWPSTAGSNPKTQLYPAIALRRSVLYVPLEQGEQGFSCAVDFAQLVQSLAAVGVTAYAGSITFAQIMETFAAASKMTYTGTAALTQSAQTLSAGAVETILGNISLAQVIQSLSAVGKETFTGAIGSSQPIQIIASDGKQTYVGQIGEFQGAMTLALAGQTEYKSSISMENLLSLISASAEMGSPYGAYASASFQQFLQSFNSTAFTASRSYSMEVLTGRKYRSFKQFRYDKKGKRTFAKRGRY
jgi:hypothetical protein